MRTLTRVGAALGALVTLLAIAAPARAAETPAEASGSFVFYTANGIAPTWQLSSLRISAVTPSSALANQPLTRVRIGIPIVAQLGSASFGAGGFRITNTSTGDYVTCGNPVIDTRARVIDCVMNNGRNYRLFGIASIGSVSRTTGNYATTTYRRVALKVADEAAADLLNSQLGAYVFSTSVSFATGQLTVTTSR